MTSRFITDLSLDEIKNLVVENSQPSFRAKQIFSWLWQHRVESFDEMSNLPVSFRASLVSQLEIGRLVSSQVLESSAGDAVKFGFQSRDNWVIESVLLIDGDRRSLCVSSQIGCGMGCTFCRTGKLGFIRNLSVGEILGQVAAVDKWLRAKGDDRRVGNIVFMGMGEALLNYKAFRTARAIIMSEDGFAIGGRKITVSTSGVIPAIERFAAEHLNVGLAISLNSFNDTKRSAVMPVNRRWPISELVRAAKDFQAETKADLTFEYVVIEDENDSPAAAAALISYLRGFPCKINLIPLNPFDKTGIAKDGDVAADRLGRILSDAGITVTVRKSRGRDIDGACGQLTSSSVVSDPS